MMHLWIDKFKIKNVTRWRKMNEVICTTRSLRKIIFCSSFGSKVALTAKAVRQEIKTVGGKTWRDPNSVKKKIPTSPSREEAFWLWWLVGQIRRMYRQRNLSPPRPGKPILLFAQVLTPFPLPQFFWPCRVDNGGLGGFGFENWRGSQVQPPIASLPPSAGAASLRQ